jgi:hypothetical protein
LVLVGHVREGFYPGLRLLAGTAGLFRGFIVHDVTGAREKDNVLRSLTGHMVSFGQLPWFGEVRNRQMLVDLLPAGEIGMLVDSRTVARKTGKSDRFSTERNRFSSVFFESGVMSRRANVFRGGVGLTINPSDYTQVENPDGDFHGSFDSFEFERF